MLRYGECVPILNNHKLDLIISLLIILVGKSKKSLLLLALRALKNAWAILLDGERLSKDVFMTIQSTEVLRQIEGRLAWTLDRDWQMRHGGIMRKPSELVLYRKYSRAEAINHFGIQYDPQRHNVGVCWFGNECMIMTKLDTSGAHTQFQYYNRLVDTKTFVWSSQNRQRRDNEAGRRITEHQKRGLNLTFVRSASIP